MAIYSNTRAMIDPSLIAMVEQAKQNRLNNYNAIKDNLTKGTREMISGLSDNVGKGITKYNRMSEVEDDDIWNVLPEESNDPVFKAARQHFIETGDSSQLNAYRMAKANEKAREEEKIIRAQEAEARNQEKMALDKNIDTEKVNEWYNQMVQTTDPFEQDQLEKKIKTLNAKWGGSLISDEEIEQKKQWKKDQAVKKSSFYNAKAEYKDLIRKAKNETERKKVMEYISNDPELDFDLEEKEKLLDWADKYQTPEEKRIEASRNATYQYAGERTKQNLEDKEWDKKANTYVGKTMTRDEFNALGDELKKRLKIDSKTGKLVKRGK